MEYQDYVNFHQLFGKCDGKEELTNPHSIKQQWCTRYNKETGIVYGPWFELSEDTFKLTRPHNSPWTIGMEYAYTEVPFNKMLPKIITIEYLTNQEFTVNGHKAHQFLEISLETGKATYYLNAAYPNTDEEKTAATSTLRKHITAYKRKARPIYRLLEGSLTQNDKKKNNSGYRGNGSDNLEPHELYEMLRLRSPTPTEIDLLMKNGNSSMNYSYISNTNFESTISRVIQRRRKDLQSFALMEANNEYLTPTELKTKYINPGVSNGTTS